MRKEKQEKNNQQNNLKNSIKLKTNTKNSESRVTSEMNNFFDKTFSTITKYENEIKKEYDTLQSQKIKINNKNSPKKEERTIKNNTSKNNPQVVSNKLNELTNSQRIIPPRKLKTNIHSTVELKKDKKIEQIQSNINSKNLFSEKTRSMREIVDKNKQNIIKPKININNEIKNNESVNLTGQPSNPELKNTKNRKFQGRKNISCENLKTSDIKFKNKENPTQNLNTDTFRNISSEFNKNPLKQINRKNSLSISNAPPLKKAPKKVEEKLNPPVNQIYYSAKSKLKKRSSLRQIQGKNSQIDEDRCITEIDSPKEFTSPKKKKIFSFNEDDNECFKSFDESLMNNQQKKQRSSNGLEDLWSSKKKIKQEIENKKRDLAEQKLALINNANFHTLDSEVQNGGTSGENQDEFYPSFFQKDYSLKEEHITEQKAPSPKNENTVEKKITYNFSFNQFLPSSSQDNLNILKREHSNEDSNTPDKHFNRDFEINSILSEKSNSKEGSEIGHESLIIDHEIESNVDCKKQDIGDKNIEGLIQLDEGEIELNKISSHHNESNHEVETYDINKDNQELDCVKVRMITDQDRNINQRYENENNSNESLEEERSFEKNLINEKLVSEELIETTNICTKIIEEEEINEEIKIKIENQNIIDSSEPEDLKKSKLTNSDDTAEICESEKIVLIKLIDNFIENIIENLDSRYSIEDLKIVSVKFTLSLFQNFLKEEEYDQLETDPQDNFEHDSLHHNNIQTMQ